MTKEELLKEILSLTKSQGGFGNWHFNEDDAHAVLEKAEALSSYRNLDPDSLRWGLYWALLGLRSHADIYVATAKQELPNSEHLSTAYRQDMLAINRVRELLGADKISDKHIPPRSNDREEEYQREMLIARYYGNGGLTGYDMEQVFGNKALDRLEMFARINRDTKTDGRSRQERDFFVWSIARMVADLSGRPVPKSRRQNKELDLVCALVRPAIREAKQAASAEEIGQRLSEYEAPREQFRQQSEKLP